MTIFPTHLHERKDPTVVQPVQPGQCLDVFSKGLLGEGDAAGLKVGDHHLSLALGVERAEELGLGKGGDGRLFIIG